MREVGGKPFLIPAMGSHGGATAEGQAELLRRLGDRDSISGFDPLANSRGEQFVASVAAASRELKLAGVHLGCR